MFMAASSVTRYLRTKGSATRVMVWDVLHVRQKDMAPGVPYMQAAQSIQSL